MSKVDENEARADWSDLTIAERAEGVRISVQVRPRSSRSAVLGVRKGALDVALTSPPVDGAANDELVKLLARALDAPRSDLEIVVGATGRSKVIAMRGVDAADVRARLAKVSR